MFFIAMSREVMEPIPFRDVGLMFISTLVESLYRASGVLQAGRMLNRKQFLSGFLFAEGKIFDSKISLSCTHL